MEGCRLIAYPLVGINESTCTPQPIPAKIGNDPRVDNIIIRITEASLIIRISRKFERVSSEGCTKRGHIIRMIS